MTRARLLARPARGPEAVAHALRSGQATALGWLRPAPTSPAAWAAEAQAAEAVACPLPAAAWEALARRQEALGGAGAASANARALAQPGTLAVVTGQQPGLLGGPLLTWHKAAGALALARRVAQATGRAVVPVFWLASEDHDVEEANQATLLDREGQPRAFALPLVPDRRSLVDVPLDVEAHAALCREAVACLPDTARAREALAALEARAGDDFAAPFARLLARVLGPEGLVVLDVRTLAPWLGRAFARLARAGEGATRAVRESAPTLRAAGFAAPLDPRAGDLPLFVRAEPGGPRQRLGVDARGGALRDGRPLGRPLEALAQEFEHEPALASPDVVGRVLLQNDILPVLAYVAGPTELAYQAQVAAAARALGTRFPLALPRPSAVWLDQRAQATAEAFGRTPDEVLDGALPEARGGDEGVRAFLAATADALEERRAAARALQAGPQGARALEAGLARLASAYARERAAIEAALEADAGVSAGRWVRLTNLVRPRGRPQERVLSALTLLARYGREALEAGLRALDPLADGLWLLTPDADDPATPPAVAPPAPPVPEPPRR